MTDTQILTSRANQVAHIISNANIPINQQKDAICNVLKDVEGEIIIETCIFGGNERISKVDVKPAEVTIFEGFSTSQDKDLIALVKLYAAYLNCERYNDGKSLYKALLDYERATHYPVTKSSPEDIDWMQIEASAIIDGTIIQPEYCTSKADIVSKIKNTFPTFFK